MDRRCSFCNRLVDPDSRRTWRRVVGWGRPGNNGGSDITLRQPRDEYACEGCIAKEKNGVAATQGALI